MVMQRINTAMIDASAAEEGSRLEVAGGGTADFVPPGASDPLFDGNVTYNYDPETGTLTVSYPDGRQQSVSGFIRASDLQQAMRGAPGLPGAPGTPGKDGRAGRDGGQGCAGRKGDRGRMGPTGGTGPRGSTGNTGPTGDTGPTGPDGPPGKDAVKADYTVVQYVDPDTEIPYEQAYSGYDNDVMTGRIINSGRVIARALRDTINVTFQKPFQNHVLSLSITFMDATTNQARTYKLYNHARKDGTFENSMLGGFVIKCSGTNAADWDFFYTAMGD